MPEISRFYGVVITMYANDHPPPHFHARYAEHEVLITIDPIRVYEGELPSRAQSLVFEWAAMHQQELTANWKELRAGRRPRRIAPLA